MNEKKAFDKSRQRDKPVGRYMGVPQMLHQLLGYSDIRKTMDFETIETLPFEYRTTTNIRLDRNGNVVAGRRKKKDKSEDTGPLVTDSCSLRTKSLPQERHFTAFQQLLLQPTEGGSTSYDSVSLFGLTPVEILKIFPRLRQYYEWFDIDDKVMKPDDIAAGLDNDVTKCLWIDGLGRRVMLRQRACKEALEWLKEIRERDLNSHSRLLLDHLMELLTLGKPDDKFIKKDDGKELPIVVFSRVHPNRSSNFLLHVMLVLGEFDTELDLKAARTMKESLAIANLIPNGEVEDEETLRHYGENLLSRVIHEVLPLQPVTMPMMDDFIVKSDELFQSVLLHNSIPMTDIPPSILSEVFNEKTKELTAEWDKVMRSQLDSIYESLGNSDDLPSKEEVMGATKVKPLDWSPLSSISRVNGQEDGSVAEQKLAIELGVNAVDKYCKQFGRLQLARGILNNGSPGAGKTYCMCKQGLYAMTQGLRVMSSSLMAVRANAIGGYHLHRLFQWEVGKTANLFRLAEVRAAHGIFSVACLDG